MATNIAYERRKAVANAWKKEKGLVAEGSGTRDWSQKEQKEILLKGKATGYEGHHMKSVDGHNSRAGDANNIQFLNRKEHLAAHGGNFRNNTNGCYNQDTGETRSFGRNKPSIDVMKLSNPLSEKQINDIAKMQSNNSAKKKNSAGQASSMSSRNIKTGGAGANESKTLTKQKALRAEKAKSSNSQSSTLGNSKNAPSQSSNTNKNKHSQKH